MANQSKSFRMTPGLELEEIVGSVEAYLRGEKYMETQSSATTDGFVLQASQPKDGWKTISGTRLAITVQFMQVSDVLNVTIGEGQWSDKLGAGAIGWFVAWPLAITAGLGAVRQKKLPAEIFAEIEKIIMLGGRQIAINGAGAKVKEGMIVCPSCKTQNNAGFKFCKKCGARLQNNCPDCGYPLAPDAHFCTNCGKKLD